MMPQVYVDLDGVMFDFDAHYEACFGVRPSKDADNVDWSKVRSFPGFYRTMPLMADWRELWDFVTMMPRAPIILTGVPKALKEVAAAEKRDAVFEKLGDAVEVITCASADKFAVLKRTPGAVLIDDWERYKPKWIAAGGQWITHTSAKDSVRQLLELMGGVI